MDTTAKLWDVASGAEKATLAVRNLIQPLSLSSLSFSPLSLSLPQGHSAEVITLSFDTAGDSMVTGSFDHTVLGWDVTTGK